MRSKLYFLAVILVIVWAFGLFIYNVGSIIHILLVLALIAILIGVGLGQKHRRARKKM